MALPELSHPYSYSRWNFWIFFFKIEKIIQLELFSSCNLRAPLHPAGRGGSPDIMAENVSAPYSVPLSYISAPTPTPTPGIMREGEAWT